MTIFQSIILGIVQGITELLPISSSAHLTIIPWFFNWPEIGAFDVALHFGTLIAIVCVFFKDWLVLLKAGFENVKGKKTREGNMFWYLVIATIPGGAIGFLLDHFLDEKLSTMYLLIGVALIVMGIILYLADKYCKGNTKYEDMTFKQTFLIGLSQSLAFIPGVSRSGITMTTGRLLGVSREAVAKYSFMLSTPIVLGATLYKFKDFVLNASFFIGILASAIVGFIVIKFLLDYLKKGSFKVFAIYRCIIGLVVIAVAFARM